MSDRRRNDVDGVLYADAVYTTGGVLKALGIGEHKLNEERDAGNIEGYEYGRGYYYLGSDVIELIKKRGQKGK